MFISVAGFCFSRRAYMNYDSLSLKRSIWPPVSCLLLLENCHSRSSESVAEDSGEREKMNADIMCFKSSQESYQDSVISFWVESTRSQRSHLVLVPWFLVHEAF